MTKPAGQAANIAEEFAGLDLGDKRLDRRAQQCASRIAEAPETSFPKAYEDDAAGLEGLYRLMNSPRVRPARLLRPHIRKTIGRCRELPRVLAISDTSEFEFGGDTDREGLGPINGNDQGFLLHTTLMLDPATNRPLGVIAAKPWVRERWPEGRKGKANKKLRKKRRKLLGVVEQQRWNRNVRFVQRVLAGGPEVVSVGDRETDDYSLMTLAHGGSHPHFVYRLRSKNRKIAVVDDDDEADAHRAFEQVRDAVARATPFLRTTVTVSARKHGKNPTLSQRTRYQARQGREAKLEVGALKLCMPRPANPTKPGLPSSLELNLVFAREVDTPPGLQPVEWLLYTDLPVDTAEQILEVLRIYRARWNIEIYFDALKNGCAVQKRQLASLDALLIALMIFLPIAWRMMLLRALAERQPDAPATEVLSPVQIEVLRISLTKTKLSENPSVKEVLFAIAALGGHLKHNGNPGWRTLLYGYEKLLTIEIGWRAALKKHGAQIAGERPKAPSRAQRRSD
jgi:hypothetical protein